MRVIDPSQTLTRVRKLGTRGRAGLRVLEELLVERLHLDASGSPLEAELWRLLKKAPPPLPDREFTVLDEAGRPIGRVDFAYVAERVAIEVDGYAYHQGRRRFDADRERHNRLADAGWLSLVFTKAHIRDRPAQTVETIRRARLRRRRARGG
jgi:very-short-patch-repair endonuclease